MPRLSPGRLVAVRVGAAAREREAYAGELLGAYLAKARLSRRDAAFARALCLGVAATSGTLDEVIDRSLRAPSDIKPDVRDALRISAYELVFMEKTAHAAVDQGVELVRAVQPKAARLANAVLHKMLAVAQDFPFGDPKTDDGAFARSQGFPLWLARIVMAEVGREGAERFMRASNAQAPLFFGLNAVKAPDADTVADLAHAGVSLQPVQAGGSPIPGCYRVADATAVGTQAVQGMFADGRLLVSDAAAQYVASIAVPGRMPRSFLEVGAGRGTKTVLLQANAQRRFGFQMTLTALDSRSYKLDITRRRAKAYGIEVAETLACDARRLDDAVGQRTFDAILVDAPCSGLGTLRRHPEIRWRMKPEDIDVLARLQSEMLAACARHLAPGGQLTYATCTIGPKENAQVVEGFLDGEAGAAFELARPYFRTTLASGSSDAHFAAVLRRAE